uniref:Uncharacterized protein n=1 Tax=Zea mays TaxID=4577 RepID=A0A804QYZ9_MAIZE
MPGHNCPHLPPSYRATVPPTHTTVSSHPLPAAPQSQISPPPCLPRLPYKHGGVEPDVPRSQISLPTSPELLPTFGQAKEAANKDERW